MKTQMLLALLFGLTNSVTACEGHSCWEYSLPESATLYHSKPVYSKKSFTEVGPTFTTESSSAALTYTKPSHTKKPHSKPHHTKKSSTEVGATLTTEISSSVNVCPMPSSSKPAYTKSSSTEVGATLTTKESSTAAPPYTKPSSSKPAYTKSSSTEVGATLTTKESSSVAATYSKPSSTEASSAKASSTESSTPPQPVNSGSCSPYNGSKTGLASTTRYYDGSTGACGCGDPTVWQLNPGAGLYTAAGSQNLYDGEGSSGSWCGSGCGTCYSLTNLGYIAAEGQGSCGGAGDTITVMITNLCPAEGNSQWCSQPEDQYGYGAHFDIMAQNPPDGWDNPVVSYKQVACPGTFSSDFNTCECASTSRIKRGSIGSGGVFGM